MMVWVIENAVVAVALGAVVALICRYLRPRPAVAHVLWVVVLLKLMTPPFGLGVWPPESVRAWIDDVTTTAPQAAADAVAMNTLERRLDDLILDPRRAEYPEVIRNKSGELGATVRAEADLSEMGLDAGERTFDQNVDAEGETVLAAATATPMEETGEIEPNAEPIAAVASTPYADSAKKDARAKLAAARQEWITPLPAPTVTETNDAFGLAGLLGPVLLIIWAAGAVIFAGVHLRRIRIAGRLVRRGAPAPAALETRVAALAAELGVRPPRVRVTSAISAPLIWASLRPTLMWPVDLLGAPEPRQRAMIAHELAHLRRRDHVTAWLELVVTALWWFHPLVWVVRPRLRAAAELACDAWVVGLRPDSRREYAEALIDACVRHMTPQPQGALALGVVTDDAALFEERLSLIMRDGRGAGLTPLGLGAMILVAGVVLPSWSLGGPVDDDAAPRVEVRDTPDHALSEAVLLGQIRAAVRTQDWSAVFAAAERLTDHSPNSGEGWHWLGYTAIGAGHMDLAGPAFEKQVKLGFRPAVGMYNQGCVAARQGDVDRAFDRLNESVRLGMASLEQLDNDPDLVSLHDDERWSELRDVMRNAVDLRQQANRAVEATRWNAALSAAESLAVLQPKSPVVAMQFGEAHLGRGEIELADASFARAAKNELLAPKAAWGRARAAAAKNDAEATARHLTTAMELGFARVRRMRGAPEFASVANDPAFQVFLNRLDAFDHAISDGEIAFHEERWADVVSAYRIALDIDPDAEHWHRLALAYRQLGDDANAQAAWRQELVASKGSARSLYNLACAAARLGDPYLALKRLDQAIVAGFSDMMLMATDADLESIRAESAFNNLLRRAGDAESLQMFQSRTWAEAYERANAMVKEDPEAVRAHLQLGFAALRLDRLDEAEAAFNRMIELGQARSIATYNLACVDAARGDIDNAFERLEQAMEAGFNQIGLLVIDPDLAPLHDDPRFASLRARLAPSPTAGPRSDAAYGAVAP